jgi:hypothetical protein
MPYIFIITVQLSTNTSSSTFTTEFVTIFGKKNYLYQNNVLQINLEYLRGQSSDTLYHIGYKDLGQVIWPHRNGIMLTLPMTLGLYSKLNNSYTTI